MQGKASFTYTVPEARLASVTNALIEMLSYVGVWHVCRYIEMSLRRGCSWSSVVNVILKVDAL